MLIGTNIAHISESSKKMFNFCRAQPLYTCFRHKVFTSEVSPQPANLWHFSHCLTQAYGTVVHQVKALEFRRMSQSLAQTLAIKYQSRKKDIIHDWMRGNSTAVLSMPKLVYEQYNHESIDTSIHLFQQLLVHISCKRWQKFLNIKTSGGDKQHIPNVNEC